MIFGIMAIFLSSLWNYDLKLFEICRILSMKTGRDQLRVFICLQDVLIIE